MVEYSKKRFILHQTHNQYLINKGNYICYDKQTSTFRLNFQ